MQFTSFYVLKLYLYTKSLEKRIHHEILATTTAERLDDFFQNLHNNQGTGCDNRIF